jgi:hypothetical protein
MSFFVCDKLGQNCAAHLLMHTKRAAWNAHKENVACAQHELPCGTNTCKTVKPLGGELHSKEPGHNCAACNCFLSAFLPHEANHASLHTEQFFLIYW